MLVTGTGGRGLQTVTGGDSPEEPVEEAAGQPPQSEQKAGEELQGEGAADWED